MLETHQKEVSWRRPVGIRGQVVIPIELRESLGNPQEVEFIFDGCTINIKGVKKDAPKTVQT